MTSQRGDSNIQSFFDWWIGSLSKLLTPRPAAKRAWRTLLLHRGNGFEILKNAGRNAVSIAIVRDTAAKDQLAMAKKALRATSRRAHETVIRLSADDVLEHTIEIPSAARDVVEPVLQNQMERIVPWPANETCYGYQIVGDAEGPSDQLKVRVVATRQPILEGALAQARALGLSASAVDFAPPDQTRPGVELLSLRPDPVRRTAERLKVGILGVALSSITASALGLYLVWQEQLEKSELDARAAVLQNRLIAIKQRSEKNMKLRAERSRLIQRKRGTPSVTVLLEALSRALPDSAYLNELEISGREARLEGKAEEPTGLISKIESAKQFANARFAAPTTRNEEDDVGTFSIIATGRPALLGELEP